MNLDKNLGVSEEQAKAMTDAFFEQLEPKVKKGRAWTFHRLAAACDEIGRAHV